MGDDKIIQWKKQGKEKDLPKKIIRPCDYGLMCAVRSLETQVGTIEAYNRLVDAANILYQRIKIGDIEVQNKLFAGSINGSKWWKD